MDKIVVATEQGVLSNPENLLEQIVVTEQEIVVVSTDTTGVVITGIMGPPGSNATITGASDIDITDLTDGATLVYRADTSVWKATNKLDNQILEAGQF